MPFINFIFITSFFYNIRAWKEISPRIDTINIKNKKNKRRKRKKKRRRKRKDREKEKLNQEERSQDQEVEIEKFREVKKENKKSKIS